MTSHPSEKEGAGADGFVTVSRRRREPKQRKTHTSPSEPTEQQLQLAVQCTEYLEKLFPTFGMTFALKVFINAHHKSFRKWINQLPPLQPLIPQPLILQPSTPQPSTPQPPTPQPSTPQPPTPQPPTPQPPTPQPSAQQTILQSDPMQIDSQDLEPAPKAIATQPQPQPTRPTRHQTRPDAPLSVQPTTGQSQQSPPPTSPAPPTPPARLVLQDQSALPTDLRLLRDQINEKLGKIVVAAIHKSAKNNTVLTTTPWFTADFLLKNKRLWAEFFPTIRNATKPETWHKVVAHGVPLMEEEDLVREISAFNGGHQWLKQGFKPRWLTTPEQRKGKTATSVVFAVTQHEDKKTLLRNGLFVAGKWVKVVKWKPYTKFTSPR